MKRKLSKLNTPSSKLFVSLLYLIKMAQAQPQSHGVNRPNSLGPYNPIKKHSEPERYVSIKNQSSSMTTKKVTLDFGFIKQLCKRANALDCQIGQH